MNHDSVFSDIRNNVYKYRYRGVIEVGTLVGGTPSDPVKAEAWLRTKLGETRDEIIRAKVAEVMTERAAAGEVIDPEEATKIVVANEHLNGFKRDAQGLLMDGRTLKAAAKEASCIRWPRGKWGETSKGTKSFIAEHFFIEEEKLHIYTEASAGKYVHATEPTGVHQRFVHTFRGSGIQYEEFVENAILQFTVVSDHNFTRNEFGELWVTSEMNGFGASRSQGFGRFNVIEWEQVPVKNKKAIDKGPAKTPANLVHEAMEAAAQAENAVKLAEKLDRQSKTGAPSLRNGKKPVPTNA